MANRYWVGGTGNWSDNTNHWSATSGGSSGASLPTSSDNVFIDSNSGLSGGTLTLNYPGGQADCNDFSSTTGFSYTIVNDAGFYIYKDLTLESGVTINKGSGVSIYGSGNHMIKTNNANILDTFLIEGTGTSTLGGDLVLGEEFYQSNGTFDANDYNVTANDFYFYAATGNTPTVIMGSGMWEITGDNEGWYLEEYDNAEVIILSETSILKFTGTNSYLENYNDVLNKDVGKNYHNIWITKITNITGEDNVFNDIKINAGGELQLDHLTTTYTNTFTAIGTTGNLITLSRSGGTGSDQFTLSKSSGIVSCDYLDLSNCNVTGGALWFAGKNSADTDNNDGWYFTVPSLITQNKPATSLANTSKPTTSIVNSTRVSIGETWASDPYTWAAEPRTWLAVSQLFTNSTRPI